MDNQVKRYFLYVGTVMALVLGFVFAAIAPSPTLGLPITPTFSDLVASYWPATLFFILAAIFAVAGYLKSRQA
jgi:hypothetical protein